MALEGFAHFCVLDGALQGHLLPGGLPPSDSKSGSSSLLQIGLFGIELHVPPDERSCCDGLLDPPVPIKLTLVNFQNKREHTFKVFKTGGDYMSLDSDKHCTHHHHTEHGEEDEKQQQLEEAREDVWFRCDSIRAEAEAEKYIEKHFSAKCRGKNGLVCIGRMRVQDIPVAFFEDSDLSKVLEGDFQVSLASRAKRERYYDHKDSPKTASSSVASKKSKVSETVSVPLEKIKVDIPEEDLDDFDRLEDEARVLNPPKEDVVIEQDISREAEADYAAISEEEAEAELEEEHTQAEQDKEEPVEDEEGWIDIRTVLKKYQDAQKSQKTGNIDMEEVSLNNM